MQTVVRQLALGFLSLWLAGCQATRAPLPEPAVGAVVRVPFEVELGGWTTSAEVMHPALDGPHGKGPYPTVLLICGNGPHDMDVTLPGPEGGSKLFLTISEVLAARGFAVVRYHKRFVKGPGKFDARYWKEQSTLTFLGDAGKVLDAALQQAACDRERVFVYGWSEGTAIGAALAVQRHDIDGLVLQGPVGLPYRDMVRAWIEEVGLPYVQGPDGGPIHSASLTAAVRGQGGTVAKLAASFFVDPVTQYRKQVAISHLLDTNGDGVLNPATETQPAIARIVDFAFGPQGNCYIYAEGRTVPTVTEQAAQLHMPVLILQGENDASTPVRGGEALAAALREAGNLDVTLRRLPGLGHTLGPATSLIDDCGRAPSDATLAPIATWLRDRSLGHHSLGQ
jgi:uncharacterized protein